MAMIAARDIAPAISATEIEVDFELSAAHAPEDRGNSARIGERSVVEPARDERREETQHGRSSEGCRNVEPLIKAWPGHQDESDFKKG